MSEISFVLKAIATLIVSLKKTPDKGKHNQILVLLIVVLLKRFKLFASICTLQKRKLICMYVCVFLGQSTKLCGTNWLDCTLALCGVCRTRNNVVRHLKSRTL